MIKYVYIMESLIKACFLAGVYKSYILYLYVHIEGLGMAWCSKGCWRQRALYLCVVCICIYACWDTEIGSYRGICVTHSLPVSCLFEVLRDLKRTRVLALIFKAGRMYLCVVFVYILLGDGPCNVSDLWLLNNVSVWCALESVFS